MADVHSYAQDPDELFDVLTAEGAQTGQVKRRADVHRDGDWHRALHIWVAGRDERGEPFLIVQRRSPAKDTWPGRYDTTIGGHYRAGETIEDTLREAEEEIGVTVDLGSLRPLGTRRASSEQERGIVDREIQDVFLLLDDRPLTSYRPHPAELSSLDRFSLRNLLPFLAGQSPSLSGLSAPPDATSAHEIFATTDDFIPTLDRYLFRVAIAVQNVLRGDRYVAI
ncbi:MAG: NUDIX domain-containing protein [Thermomicrobiales bacterium]